MKKAIGVLAIIMIMALCLCACEQTNTGIFGTWESNDSVKTTLVLRDDGTGYHKTMGGMFSVSFAYSLKDGKITFHELNDNVFGDEPYSYSISGNKLTITQNNTTTEFTKQN